MCAAGGPLLKMTIIVCTKDGGGNVGEASLAHVNVEGKSQR